MTSAEIALLRSFQRLCSFRKPTLDGREYVPTYKTGARITTLQNLCYRARYLSFQKAQIRLDDGREVESRVYVITPEGQEAMKVRVDDADAHSKKGLATIAAQGTKATDWSLTPIRWVRETVKKEVKVDCPKCFGHGRTQITADGRYAEELYGEAKKAATGYVDFSEFLRSHGATYTTCPNCKKGKVKVLRDVDVMVGYLEWLPNISFRSRFRNYEKHVCELCGQRIKDPFNWVPVQAEMASGNLGMWLGRDCAHKVYKIEVPKKVQGLETVIMRPEEKQP